MSFPFKEEKQLRLLWDNATREFEDYLYILEGKEEITKNDERKLRKKLDNYSDELAIKLVDSVGSFQGQVYAVWMAELKLKDPLVYTEITNSKSWVQDNIKYHKETADRSFKKIQQIRTDRKIEYLKTIGDQFEFRVNKAELGKGDIKYIKSFLKAQGYNKKIPNLDKYTGTDLKKLTQWIRRRNELVARDMAGNIYSQEIKELALVNEIKDFIWFTEQDNRVRPTHIVRQGKKFSFAKADFLPGAEILCRCWANPIKPRKKK